MLGILSTVFIVLGVILLGLICLMGLLIIMGVLTGMDVNDKDYFYDIDGE